MQLERIADTTVPVVLVTSPVWTGVLENVNVVLTTLTLLIGLVLGVIKVFDYLKERKES